MGKKIPAEMAAQKEKLLKGFQEFGKLTPARADQLWKLIEPFAAYGFNKAHAACYGKVAYQTAYLKANYPVEYMAAVLTADAGDTESISVFVSECERMGIPVLPPDVNESGTVFTVVPKGGPDGEDAIRFGLSSIKNFGEGIAMAILTEREANGQYASLSDFLSRVANRSLNRKSLESLIKSGALDRFEPNRGHLLTHIETLLAFHRDATAETPQDSLFGAMALAPTLTLPKAAGPTPSATKLAWERELLGIYVSGHPLNAHASYREKAGTDLKRIKEDPMPGITVILPVLITETKAYLTKGGDRMAFVTFDDTTDTIEGVIFPKLFKEHSAIIVPGSCVLIKGNISIRNGEATLAVENLKSLDKAPVPIPA
jgi:DNA polymerase-3 subunit alpha